MSSDSIFYLILSAGIAGGYGALFYISRTAEKHMQNTANTLEGLLKNLRSYENLTELSEKVVELHRLCKTLETTVEQYQLQVADVKDIVKRTTARWSMQKRRAEADVEGQADADEQAAAGQLLDDLEPVDHQVEQPSRVGGRRRRPRPSTRRF